MSDDFPLVPGQTYDAAELGALLGLPEDFLEQDEYRVAWQDENGEWKWGEDDDDASVDTVTTVL